MIPRIVLCVVLSIAPTVFAQTYLVPDGDCGAVALHARGEAAGADRVQDAYFYVAKERVALEAAADAGSAAFHANVPEDGVVMAAVSFKPEIHGNETRTAHAKAILFCSATTPLADWQRSTGLGLEIYPQEWNGRRPQLKAGDTMGFIAVDRATRKLIADLPMELYRAGGTRIAEGVPNPKGGMNFPYQEPGRYLVTATYRRPDPQQADHWLVDTSTLTFEIK